MILFKNSKHPIHILSGRTLEGEIKKWQDHREQLIALHLGLYLKGEQHRKLGPSITKVLDDFHVKEAVEEYRKKD